MTKKLLLLLMLLSVLMYAGCGGSGGGASNPYGGCVIPSPEDNDIFSSLGGGRVVDVSKFNSCDHIYTTITAIPEKKLEGNGEPPVLYSGKLLTTAGTILDSSLSITKNRSSRSLFLSSRSKQVRFDSFARQVENDILASRAKQLSKKSSHINFSAPATIAIGTQWNNVQIVNDPDSMTFTTINTTCKNISEHAYFFIDNRDLTDSDFMSSLSDYATAFETIYSINHAKFGAVNDSDGNGKVIIVFSRELTDGLLGYFFAVDKFPKSSTYPFSYSNEGDIFYVTTASAYQGDTIKATLAHELQHMIYFDEHYKRGVTNIQSWLNEALSQAAEYYNNYLTEHENWMRDYLQGGYYWLSLTYWTQYNYGYGALFIRYLIDRYGDTAIKNMCSTDKVGIAAVEDATGTDFNALFYNFSRALVLSGTGMTVDERFNFIDLQALGGFQPEESIPAGEGGKIDMYPYEIYLLEWTGDFGTMQLSGDLAGDVFGISILP